VSSVEEKKQQLSTYIAEQGLRHTHQRELILEEFLKKHQHLTIEELWEQVRKVDPSIGYATVYRTLKLFTECGIADKHEFGEGSSRYESASNHHHDHLICRECGTIIEFENDQIEKLQERVCREHNFEMTHHRMELYGRCIKCRKA
jgi:Fur family transcriptional regulator, ferric uptake regulator